MSTVRSSDGTRIEFDEAGTGAPVILIDGALCTRSFGSKPELVRCLAPHFAVYSYDRRGRGGSGDTPPYAVEREIEDLEALIEACGGRAFVYGHSSGACLGLEAAAVLGSNVARLAMYEAPYNDDPTARTAWAGYLRRLADALDSGRPGDAVALFMAFVGTPDDQIEAMRQAPIWPQLVSVAPTLAYDHAGLLGADGSIPRPLARRVSTPTLVMHGAASFPFMGDTARALSDTLASARLRTFPGQDHNIDPALLSPVLVEFFGTG